MPEEILKDKETSVAEQLKYSMQAELNGFLLDTCKVADKAELILTEQEILPLNLILGGGLPVGNLIMLIGRSGGGKSTLAAHLLANAQKKYGEKHLSIYIDNECTMTALRLSQLGICNPYIKPVSGLTLEKVFETIENVCIFKQEKGLHDYHVTIVWDSLSNTLTQKEMDCVDPKSVIGYKQRCLSLFLPRIISKCHQNQITLIMINQLRDKLELKAFSKTPAQLKYLKGGKTIPGGNAVIFNSAQIISIDESESLKPEEWPGLTGHLVNVYCIKNKTFSPNIPIKLVFNFKDGIHPAWSMYNFLRDHSMIIPGTHHKLEGYLNDKGELKAWKRTDYIELYNNDKKFQECITKCYEKLKAEFNKNFADIKVAVKKSNVKKSANIDFSSVESLPMQEPEPDDDSESSIILNVDEDEPK